MGFQPSLSLKSIFYLNYVNSALSTIFSSDIRFQNKKCLKRFEEEGLNFNFWKSTIPRQLFFTPNPNLVNPVFENSYSWRVCFWKELLSLTLLQGSAKFVFLKSTTYSLALFKPNFRSKKLTHFIDFSTDRITTNFLKWC